MKEQLVSFETAKLAKAKGYKPLRSIGRFYYNYKGDFRGSRAKETEELIQAKEESRDINTTFESISAPTQALLQKWLRDKHNIFVEVQLDQTSNVKFAIQVVDYESFGNFNKLRSNDLLTPINLLYRTYEEALEEGLIEGLKRIKS